MDNYIVSARKYRPTTFQSVVGQGALTDTLKNAIRTNRLAHAYLFCGPRGVGKTTCARIFAKTINCLNPTADHDACNECESCKAFNEQRSFNIHELDAASNNSVEDIRTLIQEVRIPPQIGKYSVYIIDEVHMLSQGAFNALLKTLEEPPSYAVFILATTEKHKVLPTILSRCQVYDFQRITVKDTVQYLQYVAAQEGIEAEEQALSVVAQKADGGMRDALSIFDQLVAFCGSKISYAQTIEVLNVLDSDYYFRLVAAALQGDVPQALLIFDEILRKGFDAGFFVTGLAAHLRDVLVSKDPQTVGLLETTDGVRQHYAEQAAGCPAQWIFAALELLNNCDINYRTARNKRLTVEICLVRLCRLGQPALQVQQPQQPQQQAAAQSQSQPQRVQPVQPQSQPQQPTQNAQPQRVAMPKRISVNVNKTAAPTPAATEQKEASQRQTPFTADRLNDAWAGLKQHFPKEERLHNILSSHQPVIEQGNVIRLSLTNPWQKEVIDQLHGKIAARLREVLANDMVSLHVDVAEYKADNRPVTTEDRYKTMMRDYPQFAELKNALALQLE